MHSGPLVLSAFARELSGLISLVVLGLTFGFSPPLYGVTLHLLARSKGAWRPIVYLTVGMVLSATMLLLVFRTFDPTTLAKEFSGEVAHLLVQTVVDLVVGAILVLSGFFFVARSRRPRPAQKPATEQTREVHAQAMIGLGFANTVIGVAPSVTMYVTGRVIAGATSHLTLQLLDFLLFLAAVVAPYLLAAYFWRRIPRVANAITHIWTRVMGLDLRPYVAWGLVIAGGVFLALGAVTGVTNGLVRT